MSGVLNPQCHHHLTCEVCYAQVALFPDTLYPAHLRWHKTLSNIPERLDRSTFRPLGWSWRGEFHYFEESAMPKPAVGRIVHYVSYGTPKGEFESTCRAAIITQVGDPDVEEIGLCAINPTGLFFHESCLHQEDVKDGGTWHWPERVE